MTCRRKTWSVAAVTICLSVVLAACWDKTEMDELALVSLIGIDNDPETGTMTVYFQVINPLSNATSQGTASTSEAPVFTFDISGKSLGEIRVNTYKLLSRQLFIAHHQGVIVSTRAAEAGLRDIINYYEMLPNARTTAPLLVADGSLYELMHSFTPLERLPSDAVDARMDMLRDHTLFMGNHVDISDFIEHMENRTMAVHPMIGFVGDASRTIEETSSNIDAHKTNLIFEGGAVFRDYRMVGRLNARQLVLYNLLEGEKGQHAFQFPIGGKPVTVFFKTLRLERTVKRTQDKPVVSFRLDLELNSVYSSEHVPQTIEQIRRYERAVERSFQNAMRSFYEMSKKREWDLLHIRDLLLKHTLATPSNVDTVVKETEVEFIIRAKLKLTGGMRQIY